jgi:hypothetical protein
MQTIFSLGREDSLRHDTGCRSDLVGGFGFGSEEGNDDGGGATDGAGRMRRRRRAVDQWQRRPRVEVRMGVLGDLSPTAVEDVRGVMQRGSGGAASTVGGWWTTDGAGGSGVGRGAAESEERLEGVESTEVDVQGTRSIEVVMHSPYHVAVPGKTITGLPFAL